MLETRVRTSRLGNESGFALVELAVVIVIVGVLAAIAVPLYLDHQAKAHDAAAQQDLQVMAQSLRGALEDEPDLPTITWSGNSYLIDGDHAGSLSPGVVFGGLSGASMHDWCIDVTHPHGDVAASPGFHYSAQDGLEPGTCP